MKTAAWLERVVGSIERAEVLDKPSDQVAAVSEKLPSIPSLGDLLSGTPLGHPIHPLMVAVPIGAWSSAHLLDLAGDDDAARKLIGIGLAAAVPTMISGHSDWSYTEGAERRVGFVHAALNNVAFSAYTSSWLLRRAGLRKAGVASALIGMVALSAAGYLGGHLAYALGVGVDTTAFQQGPEEWSELAELAALHEDELYAAELGGVPVVATLASPGDVRVLAARCTHRGGPLAEGELSDGCIVCPWHGGTFALDGTVVRGPASRPQPAYQVKIEAGKVYARRPHEPRSLRTNPIGV